jgi:DNA polymerase III epsilon subunit-like protein
MYFLVFDLETTGLPKDYKASISQLANWPRIVQLAWIIFDEQKAKIKSEEYIIKPDGFIIPKDVQRVHGISTEFALENGSDIGMVLEVFLTDLTNFNPTLVSHNIDFDKRILGSELYRAGKAKGFMERSHICTMKSSTDYCKLPSSKYGNYKYPNLSELYRKLFTVDFVDKHHALSDAEAAADCFFELVERNVIRIDFQ